MIDESKHHLFQIPFPHLPVGDGQPRCGNQPLDQVGNRIDRLDTVVEKIDLPLASHLGKNRRLDQGFVERRHRGLNRQAVLRRGFDQGKITQTAERHVQSSGNRRGRKRQDVNRFTEFLQLLLMAHAETLFFVDDQQAQVLEGDVL